MALALPPTRNYKPSTRLNRTLRVGFAAFMAKDAERIKEVRSVLFKLSLELGKSAGQVMVETGTNTIPQNITVMTKKIQRARKLFTDEFEEVLINQIDDVAHNAIETWVSGIEGYAPYTTDIAWGLSERTVEAMKRRQLGKDRIPLSERIWRIGAAMDDGLNRIITNAALVHGVFPPPRELAKILEAYILPDLDMTGTMLADLFGPDWRANPVAADLAQRKRPAWQAFRLARTETIHTFHVATEIAAESTPGVIGTRCVLSNTHHARMPKGDICDEWSKYTAPKPPPAGTQPFDPEALATLLATHAPGEDRRGVFPAGKAPLEHPNGMCTRLYVLADLDKLEGLLEKVAPPVTPPVGTATLDDVAPIAGRAPWQDRIAEILANRSGGRSFFDSTASHTPDQTAYAEEALIREVGEIIDNEAASRIDARGYSAKAVEDAKNLSLRAAEQAQDIELRQENTRIALMWEEVKKQYAAPPDKVSQALDNIEDAEHRRERYFFILDNISKNSAFGFLSDSDQARIAAQMPDIDFSNATMAPSIRFRIKLHFEHLIEQYTRDAYGYRDLTEFGDTVGRHSQAYIDIANKARNSKTYLDLEADKVAAMELHQQALEDYQRIRDGRAKVVRDTYLEVLQDVRPMGMNRALVNMPNVDQVYLDHINTYRRIQKMPEYRDIAELQADVDLARANIEFAAQFYPRDWLEEFEKRAVALHVGIVKRAHAQDAPYTPHKGGRLLLSRYHSTITNDPEYAIAAIHELGHHQEYANPDVMKSEWAFYHRRTRGGIGNPAKAQERLKKLSKLVPGIYKKEEEARPDKFDNPYMGKDYGNQANDNYELLTMGMQDLFTRTGSALETDHDYRHWLLGTLASANRKDTVTFTGMPRTIATNKNPINVGGKLRLVGDIGFKVWNTDTNQSLLVRKYKGSKQWVILLEDITGNTGYKFISQHSTETEARNAAIIFLGGTPPKRGRKPKA